MPPRNWVDDDGRRWFGQRFQPPADGLGTQLAEVVLAENGRVTAFCTRCSAEHRIMWTVAHYKAEHPDVLVEMEW